MIFALLAFLLPCFYVRAYAGEVARTNSLLTSNNKEAFALFETEGNTIRARGRFASDRLRRMYFLKNEDITSSYSMKAEEDGSFTAELTAATGRGEETIILQLNSGAVLRYIVRYGESGWYFPLNSFAKSNSKALEHIYDDPEITALYYLSSTADADETAVAQEQIRLLAERATEGIEDDYKKAEAISLFIASTVYYDLDVRAGFGEIDETVALYNVLKSCRTICSGFANLYCAMLEAAGIDAVTVRGSAVQYGDPYDDLDDLPKNHEFTAFYYEAESRWVWVDSCWNGSGYYQNGEYKQSKPHLMYFDITDEALSLNHRAEIAYRRRYLTAEAPDAAITTTAENTDAPEENVTAAQTTYPKTENSADFTFTTPKAREPSDISSGDSIVYIVLISALATATAAALAVNIRIFMKRKDSAFAQRYRDMVVIELENGKKIKIELYPKTAPETVANFEKLVNKGFYDGLTFHRVISGFMIQGGCPLGNGTGNSGEHIKGEFLSNGFPNELKHTRGVISMARAADPNSASCQFFIMHEDAPHLDGSYAAFGKVVEGMDAVDEIAACETDYADKPVTPVVMKSVKLVD